MMATCSWRFDLLGNQTIRIGEVPCVAVDESERKVSNSERDNLYEKDLVETVMSYNSLIE